LSPYAVAQELDNDPEQLATTCLGLLRYAETRGASESENEATRKAYEDSPMMAMVNENTFALHKERLARRKAAEPSAERPGADVAVDPAVPRARPGASL
jgi:hypothetical protein